jgi:hypothetical protein
MNGANPPINTRKRTRAMRSDSAGPQHFPSELTDLFVMAGLKREARLRVRPGHPRLCCGQDVDARDFARTSPGHNEH